MSEYERKINGHTGMPPTTTPTDRLKRPKGPKGEETSKHILFNGHTTIPPTPIRDHYHRLRKVFFLLKVLVLLCLSRNEVFENNDFCKISWCFRFSNKFPGQCYEKNVRVRGRGIMGKLYFLTVWFLDFHFFQSFGFPVRLSEPLLNQNLLTIRRERKQLRRFH